MPLDNPVDVKFSAPIEAVAKLEQIKKELLKVPVDYKDVINPSLKSKVGKLLSSKEKRKFQERKERLGQYLKITKEDVAAIYSEYYSAESIRRAGHSLLNTIEAYCKKAGIKTIATKPYNSYSTHVKTILGEINKVADKMQTDLKALREKAALIEQEKELFDNLQGLRRASDEVKQKMLQFTDAFKGQVAERVARQLNDQFEGIEAEHKRCEDDIAKALEGISEQENKLLVLQTLDDFGRFSEGYDRLIASIRGNGVDYKAVEEGFGRFLKELQEFEKRFAKVARDCTKLKFSSPRGVAAIQHSLQSITSDLVKITEKARKINAFAEEMRKYKVFDTNMGVPIEKSLLGREELKKAAGKYAEYVRLESQECLPIAIDDKNRLDRQFNHKAGDTAIGKGGPYYILVGPNSKQVDAAIVNVAWKTINESSDEAKALLQVDEYLQKALAAATFDAKQLKLTVK